MQSLARIFFWGYTLMLVVIGASGMLVAGWELTTVFAVDLATMGEPQRATLLNQYRFLKALELAFGLFCLTYRRDIFGEPRARCLFLAGVSAGVVARGGSWMVDGTPHAIFLIFMALELATGALVWLASRRGRLT